MQELQQRPREQTTAGGPSGLDPIFGAVGDSDPSVLVGSGVYLERLPVGGMSVGEVRARFGDRLDVAPQAQAFIDGRPAGNDTLLRPGQSLRFAHRSGEKGA
jgi:hypothetical protein